MTVPTAGAHPDLLNSLIHDCGLPLDRIVVVATKPGVEVPAGVVVIEDLERPNIQRWWTVGIAEAERRGATAVAVVNDDVRVSPSTLRQLSSELFRTKAAIASPSREPYAKGVHRWWILPYEPRLWGSLWVLRLASGVRPNQQYVWWYGDNDLDIQARVRGGGVVLVDVEFEHLHPGEGTAKSPELQAQADIDARTFEAQYAHLLRASRFVKRWRERMNRRGTKS